MGDQIVVRTLVFGRIMGHVYKVSRRKGELKLGIGLTPIEGGIVGTGYGRGGRELHEKTQVVPPFEVMEIFY